MWEYLSNTTALKTPPIFASYACLYLDNEFNNLHSLSSNYHQHSKIHLSFCFLFLFVFYLRMWFKAIFNMRWLPYRIYRFFKILHKRYESLTADLKSIKKERGLRNCLLVYLLDASLIVLSNFKKELRLFLLNCSTAMAIFRKNGCNFSRGITIILVTRCNRKWENQAS